MAIGYVQSTTGVGASSASLAIPIAPNPTGGNALIVAVGRQSTVAFSTVTDSRGNLYRRAVQSTSLTRGQIHDLWYALEITGGTNTITATVTPGGPSVNQRGFIAEFSGLSTNGALLSTASGEAAASTSLPAGQVTTNDVSVLVLASVHSSAATTVETVPSGFSTLADRGVLHSVYQVYTSTVTVNPTWGLTATGDAIGVCGAWLASTGVAGALAWPPRTWMLMGVGA